MSFIPVDKLGILKASPLLKFKEIFTDIKYRKKVSAPLLQ